MEAVTGYGGTLQPSQRTAPGAAAVGLSLQAKFLIAGVILAEFLCALTDCAEPVSGTGGSGSGTGGGGDDGAPPEECPRLPLPEDELYRAVGPEEAADISEHGLPPDPYGRGYQTGKLFALTLEDAVRFGEINARLSDAFTHIVRVRYPSSLDHLIYTDRADGMCYGFIDVDDLPTVNLNASIEVMEWP